MRFGLAHRVCTTALVASGAVALLLSSPHGSLRTFVLAEVALVLLAAYFAIRRNASYDRALLLLTIGHFVLAAALGGGVGFALAFLAFVVLAPATLVLSHLRREVEGNYRQGARDRSGHPVDLPRILRSRRVISARFVAALCATGIPIVLFASLLVLLVPRFRDPRPLFHRAFRISATDLGNPDGDRTDATVIARVHLPEKHELALRLRGVAFDRYENGQWKNSIDERGPVPRSSVLLRAEKSGDSLIRIELEPIEPHVLFLPEHAVAVHLRDERPLMRGDQSAIWYDASIDALLRYEVYVGADDEDFREPFDARHAYLAVPSEISPRVRALAHEWTRNATTNAEKARAVEQRLQRDFQYTLAPKSHAVRDPLDEFLFVTKAGHCEHFSSAMAILLREVGVPTRNVTGFLGGARNRFGGFHAVRLRDAHAWVEAYVDSKWTTFDPTPPSRTIATRASIGADAYEALGAWWSRFLGYDRVEQKTLFDRIVVRSKSSVRWAYLALVLASAFALVAVIRKAQKRNRSSSEDLLEAERHERAEAATRLWMTVEDALRVRGVTRARDVPPLRFAERLRAERHDDLAEETFVLASRYALARFGGVPLTTEESREFSRRVDALPR